MNDKQNDSGSIKRSDFKLRLEYYGLKTHIYLLKTGQYAIPHSSFLPIKFESQKYCRNNHLPMPT